MTTKTCKQCNVEFTPKRSNTLFCGEKCGKKWHNDRRDTKEVKSVKTKRCLKCTKAFKTNSDQKVYCSDECLHKRKRDGQLKEFRVCCYSGCNWLLLPKARGLYCVRHDMRAQSSERLADKAGA